MKYIEDEIKQKRCRNYEPENDLWSEQFKNLTLQNDWYAPRFFLGVYLIPKKVVEIFLMDIDQMS